ncbi:MAG: cob(I)yrinic acid a,c-diamide adenosyltransferase [Bacteroidia bacterium]|nr:cob(I)yrinic acid a,c-diamide adenosyltransferase [Bacteroidia bacterium]
MKIYTRTGDDGITSLSGGRRVPKYHPRVEASGSVDELMSWIGLLRDFPGNATRKDFLTYIQNQLMTCAAVLTSDPDNKKIRKHLPDSNCALKLEKEIDKMERKLKPQKSFVLPGGNILVSYCHIARCVCRRAERIVLKLNQKEKSPEIIHIFLNRLSDYLFVLSRIISLELDIQEITWSR